MNGNRTAEELVGDAARHAKMASDKAKEVASVAVEFKQTLLRVDSSLGKIALEQAQQRTEINSGFEEVATRLARLERLPQRSLPSITEDDWEVTRNGTHVSLKKDVFEDKFTMFMKDRERREDARKWRLLWKRSKNGVYLVATGALTLSGERFVQWVWAVLSHLRLH